MNSFKAFRRLPRGQQYALAIGGVSLLWTLLVLAVGGVNFSILGLRIRANDWFDSGLVAFVSLLVFAGLRHAATVAVRPWRWRDALLLAAILAVAAFVRFHALTFGLPHPSARPDEDATSALAGSYYSGNFEQTIFTYPPLFMYVVAATMWLVFDKLSPTLRRLNLPLDAPERSTAAERILARALSAIAGVVSVWVLFRIGVRLFGRPTAFVAAAFLALAFLHVRDSHFGVTDIPMTCMVLVGFLAIVKLSESGSPKDLVAAGLLTGLAVATKYNAALLILPASFAILDDPLRRPIAGRIGRVVAFGAIVAAAFLIVCPYSLINHEKFVADLRDVSRHLADGHGPDLGRGWVYHLTTTLRFGMGLPLLAAGILGLPLLIWREGRRGLLVALFPVAYYLVTGSGRTVFARYALPLVPFLCLTAGYLVVTVATAAARYLGRPTWRVPAISMIAAVVLWPSIMSVIAFERLIATEDSRVLARRWIEARFAPGTTIAQIGPGNAHPYSFYEKNYRLADATATGRPTLIVIASSPMERYSLDVVTPWLDREYDLQFVQKVVAEDDRTNTYDMQDEFFVPLAGFHQIERPGPNLRIYVRREIPIADPAARMR